MVIASSCNIDDVITTALPPKIILDNTTGVYSVKQGHELVIAPSYENVEGAQFCWMSEGKVLSTAPQLTFTSAECATYYITLSVSNEQGCAEEELRVEVVELEIPAISILNNEAIIAEGASLQLKAQVAVCSIPTTVEWFVDEQKVQSEGTTYNFVGTAVGEYVVTARATNDDGEAESSVIVSVVSAEDMPLKWEFESLEMHTVVGRKLRIRPTAYSADENISFCWTSDNGTGYDPEFVYTPTYEGTHIVRGSISTIRGEKSVSITHEFNVHAYTADSNYRPKSGASSAQWSAVYEYTPAPGQFINELKTGGFDGSETTPEAACRYAEGRLGSGAWVSLGGFGGYIIVGFDHSIDNAEGFDFAIASNSFDSSSEPGVVWVMQDENGNGKPDDTWYELQGSESANASTIRDYAVTYYRPAGAAMPVTWSDSEGNTGEIDYLKSFHSQDYYYPAWIAEDSYTLYGTRLEARNYDKSGNGSMWIQPAYDWGYADNFSPTDFLTDDKSNRFNIDNAVDCENKAIALSHIDFVKVQCAINAKSGWLGELSTEVCGIYDINL